MLVRCMLFVPYLLLLAARLAAADLCFPENDMIANLAVNGSAGSWRVGAACDSCPRGIFSTKDFEPGEVIGRFWLHDCMDLGGRDTYLAELANQVLLRPEVNATFGDYLTSLPQVGDVPCYLTMSPKHVAMLQAPNFTYVIEQYDDYIQQLADEINERGTQSGILHWTVTPEIVRYYLGLVTTRAFDFYGLHEDTRSYMCPVLDLLNHADPGNARREEQPDGSIHVIATAPIKRGDELFWKYHDAVLSRPDMSLMIYGFVQDQEDPMLSGIDDAGFDVYSAFNPAPLQEVSDLSRTEAAAELERLQGILAGLPTTEQEDRQMLERGEYEQDKLGKTIMRWRVMRKKALRTRVQQLQKLLTEN